MRRRIVLVSPFAPVREGRHGGVRVLHGLASELADRHELVLLHTEGGVGVDPELAGRCAAVESVSSGERGRWSSVVHRGVALARGRMLWASELDITQTTRRLRSLLQRFPAEIVQVEHAVLGEVLTVVRPGRLRVLTLHETAAARRESLPFRHEGHAVARHLDAAASVRHQRRVVSLADVAVVFTEPDRARLAGAVSGTTELVTIPLGWEVPRRALDPLGVRPPALLFVGSFIHAPNVEGAVTLARRILPLVREVHPEASAEIVGGQPPPEVQKLAGDHVRVTGAVADVTPHLDRAAVVVIPIAIGGGMRIKLLEAMGAGKAVVASSRAAEGISAMPGEDLLVADDDPAIAAAVCRLLADDALRRRIAERAREWARRELSWSVMADRYDALYARAERSGRNHVRESATPVQE